jgi:hypothetical protein
MYLFIYVCMYSFMYVCMYYLIYLLGGVLGLELGAPVHGAAHAEGGRLPLHVVTVAVWVGGVWGVSQWSVLGRRGLATGKGRPCLFLSQIDRSIDRGRQELTQWEATGSPHPTPQIPQ